MDQVSLPDGRATAGTGFARRQRQGPVWLLGLVGACLGLVWVARALALGLPALAAEPPLPVPPLAKGSAVLAGNSASADPRQDMIHTLGAPGPHASMRDQAGCFDRFVGTWDCDYALFSPEGKVTRLSGQVVFGWVLDGWAMQDIWWSRSAPGQERAIGTTLRFFDRKAGLWRVTWIAPRAGAVLQLEGGPVAQGRESKDGAPGIVLNGKDTDGSLTRWTFNDIQPDAFIWRSENSRDGGRTWVMEEEHHLKRRR